METTIETSKAGLKHWKTAPEAKKAMLGLEQVIRSAGIDPMLLDFSKLRTSRVNC